MAYSHPLASHPDAKELRKEAGAYIKKLREAAGLTQQQVAKAVGMDYYTMISQVEGGKTRVPPDKQLEWARALQVEPKAFATRLLMFYDPYTWQLLFGKEEK